MLNITDLEVLMKGAYEQEDAADSYEDGKEKESEIPHFKFWSMTREWNCYCCDMQGYLEQVTLSFI